MVVRSEELAFPVVADPLPRVCMPAVPLVELTGGVTTTFDSVEVDVSVEPGMLRVVVVDGVVPLIEPLLPTVPRGAGTPPAAPELPGSTQVTSRSEQ